MTRPRPLASTCLNGHGASRSGSGSQSRTWLSVAGEGQRGTQVERHRQRHDDVGGHRRGREVGVGHGDAGLGLRARPRARAHRSSGRRPRSRRWCPSRACRRTNRPASASGCCRRRSWRWCRRTRRPGPCDRRARRQRCPGPVEVHAARAEPGRRERPHAGGGCAERVELEVLDPARVVWMVKLAISVLGVEGRGVGAAEHVDGPARAAYAASSSATSMSCSEANFGWPGCLSSGVGVRHLVGEEGLDAADRVDGVADRAAHQRQVAVLGVLHADDRGGGLREAAARSRGVRVRKGSASTGTTAMTDGASKVRRRRRT